MASVGIYVSSVCAVQRNGFQVSVINDAWMAYAQSREKAKLAFQLRADELYPQAEYTVRITTPVGPFERRTKKKGVKGTKAQKAPRGQRNPVRP